MRHETEHRNFNYNKVQKPNGFEPFEEEQINTLFVNSYHGHLASKIELNRKAVEKTLKLAHLSGQVFLTSLNQSRNRSLDANSDGSISQKKTLFIGEKPQENEGEENPYLRVITVPQGWRIEINDQKIMEELLEKKNSMENRQKSFISQFDSLIGNGLEKCIIREKLTNIKDKYFKSKLIISLLAPSAQLAVAAISHTGLRSLLIASGCTLITYGIANLGDRITYKDLIRLQKKYKEANINTATGKREIDHWWEFLMPLIEIDKVVESITYLNTFGNKLIREKEA